MKTKERIVVKIDGVAFGGDGVARVGDLVMFVPLSVDGDELDVEVVDIKKNYARGRIAGILSPSPWRVAPPCPYYGDCGGCSMQHIDFPHQLELKKRQIEEALRRIAGITGPPVAPVISSPHPLGWRGKAEFHLVGSTKAYRIGLMAAKSNRIIDVERCLIADQSINRKFSTLKGNIRSGSAGELESRLVVWADEPPEPPTAVFTGRGKPPDIIRRVKGKRLAVPGRGFFQANIFLVERLVDEAVAMASLSGGEDVIDLYSGAGLFSLFLGEKAGRLFCVEGDGEASRCARINLNRYGLEEAKCYQGDVAAVLAREFVSRGLKTDVALLDPPRDGCGEKVCDLLSLLQPKRIVYVSCNPSTQARDIKSFLNNGYNLEIVRPIDMFPQTSHVESIALLIGPGERRR